MNKGIIMEKYRNYTVILTRDGTFHKAIVADKDLDVGEEVHFEPYVKWSLFNMHRLNKRSLALKISVVTALITIFLFTAFYFTSGSKTYAYVTVDINPSIEMEIDQFLQVQNMTAINPDAEKLLSEMTSFKNEDLHTIIEEIMNKSEKQNMVEDTKNILIGVSYVENPEKEVTHKINQYFTGESEWQVITFNVPPEVRQTALEKRISMNEELALLINEKNNALEEQINLDENKKELIYSFYNEEAETEQKPETDKESLEQETKMEIRQTNENSSDIKIIGPPISNDKK